ncbi:protein GVQW3-like [Oratosquilla oratoria]|uniref:protein GVQW3-like n=1 Tax=Oratosquilla oratoria TaxID=337810 RepID=UPI003F76EAE7
MEVAIKRLKNVHAHQAMNTEQRTKLKFLVQLGKTPSEALGLLQQVYGDEMMSHSCVFEWGMRFKEGCEDMEDDPRSRMPSLGIDQDNIQKIITENFDVWKVCTKMVPKLLNNDQKERHMQVCQDILDCLETKPDLLGRVITGDESWIFKYNTETKCQSLQ